MRSLKIIVIFSCLYFTIAAVTSDTDSTVPLSAISYDISTTNLFLKEHPHEIEVVILSYNNEAYYYRNLDSVVYQICSIPFHVTYVNDKSTDATKEKVNEYRQAHHCESLVTVVDNEERKGALANLYETINALPDHKIVVLLDGDDFLAHDLVLERIAQAYRDPNIWLTYGQMIYYPEGGLLCEDLPEEVKAENSFRDYPWVTSHLRTFYAGLFQRIKRDDLLYKKEFLTMAGDVAFMLPLLEMASKGHILFIPDVLYVYNHHNPLSDHNLDRSYQIKLDRFIRTKEKYTPLD